jgi:hypothetical protein
MRADLPNSASLAITLTLSFGLISVGVGNRRTRDQSAAKLIHFLADPVDPCERTDLLDKNDGAIPAR